MKTLRLLPFLTLPLLGSATPTLAPMLSTQAPASPSLEKMTSRIYVWDQLKVEPTKTGERRALFDGPTTSLDKLHCHITTLNPGEKSGEPRLHLQEEVIIVKEGAIEVTCDGTVAQAPAGSVIFFQARAVTALRNTGNTPATYTVVNFYTPLTPKS